MSNRMLYGELVDFWEKPVRLWWLRTVEYGNEIPVLAYQDPDQVLPASNVGDIVKIEFDECAKVKRIVPVEGEIVEVLVTDWSSPREGVFARGVQTTPFELIDIPPICLGVMRVSASTPDIVRVLIKDGEVVCIWVPAI